MGFLDQLSKRAETNDHHPQPELRTHYYKASTAQIAKTIEHLVHARQWELTLANVEYQEYTIRIEKETEAVINLYQVSMLETAVDIYVNSNKMLGYSKKKIQEIFQYLDQHLQAVGK